MYGQVLQGDLEISLHSAGFFFEKKKFTNISRKIGLIIKVFIGIQRHPGGTANAVYGEATHSQTPRNSLVSPLRGVTIPPRWGRAGRTGACTPKRAPPEGETREGTKSAQPWGANVVIPHGGEEAEEPWGALSGPNLRLLILTGNIIFF